MSIKRKDSSDIAKAISLPMPAFAKKNIVVASLKPSPPNDMGKRVIAPIIGIKTKK